MEEVLTLTRPVGFDQKVLLHHLDFTATQSRKYSRKEMYTILDGYLRNDIAGAKSRKNVITMLMKIWYLVDEEMIDVRDQILHSFSDLTKEERLLCHWGMTMVAYPFFKDVVLEFGRLFQLQEEISSQSIGKRMKAAYGDRRRVEVATSAVLGSMRAWRVIIPSEKRSYKQNELIQIRNTKMQSFLIQVLLKLTQQNSLYMNQIQNHPLVFPFDIDYNMLELRENTELSFYHQGLNDLVVERNATY